MNGSESKSLLKPEERKIAVNLSREIEENEDDWWESDDGSSSGSCYSDSDCSIAEWESEIGPNGEVFYIESYPDDHEKQQKQQQQAELTESPAPELTRRRSTRAGKLMRLIRRRESKRYSTRIKKSIKNQTSKVNEHEGNTSNNKEVKFQDYQAGEIRQVVISIDPDKRHKLGRRATLCEAYLGIIPGNFSDKIRVMISGFIPNNEIIKNNKNIKIGDWLKSIDGHEVTTDNLEYILSDITAPVCVKLELQRVAGVEVTVEDKSISNLPKKSPRVQRLIDKNESKKLMKLLLNYSFGVLYLKTTGLSETGPEHEGVIYAYPRRDNRPDSILCSARGAFITLNHMSPETFGSNPVSTTISTDEETIHVLYARNSKENVTKEGLENEKNDNNELFLLSVPEQRYSLEESTKLLNDIIKTLEFTYENLNLTFQEVNHSNLDNFFSLIFTSLLDISIDLNDEKSLSDIETVEKKKQCEFESIIEAAHLINLPRDAQIQIDAALNEMEAMDYRDWNEDPMDCQRLYTILGSCLYHKSYLLASHLRPDDLLDIHTFLRLNGLLNLIENESIKLLVIWREVNPSSINNLKSDESIISTPNGKYFVLIVGFGNELLAVMMECGGCTTYPDEDEGPDVFYVEEAQETLKHIQKIGISDLADKWISSNARPETIDIQDRNDCNKSLSTIADNLLGLIKPTENTTAGVKINEKILKIPEVTSILKKKSPEQSPVMSGSIYSLQTSEDSMSQGTGAVSEISDDTTGPILGRRATREMHQASSRQSDESDSSDVDMYRNDSQTCSMNVSDIRENLLNQVEYISPIKLTTGIKNSLFHFVHLDALEGILLSSKITDNLKKNHEIISIFNETAHSIHKLFNHAVRFKNMINTEVDKTVINKNLVAIKEHGILFEFDNISFWVIGRLYTGPSVTEFYVCYQDSTPQNIVEMAFRLNENWN